MISYEPFFELREPPFSLAPDPRFRFASPVHATALAQVAHALERREPLIVVTGAIGTGKTLLCRTVLQQLPGKTFLSVIDDPLLDRDDLLKQMLQDFGIVAKDRSRLTDTTRHELVEALHAFLRSLASIKANAVVIIDEAQHLRAEVLEQIRLLSNIDAGRGTVVEVILVGQPGLETLLSHQDLTQLRQRASRWIRLAALNREEVQQYIRHRWIVAGGALSAPFTPDAIDAVSQLSRGIPRVINLLCDRALEEACAAQVRAIDGRVIQTAAEKLGVEGQVAPAASSERETERVRVRSAGEATLWAKPRLGRYAVLAASLGLSALAIVFGVRAPRPGAAAEERTSSPIAPVASPATPAPPVEASHAVTSPSEVASPAATAEQFDIVVASFRTEERAAAVAAEVATLGLPMRRRVSDGWQQVIAGPFASRASAEDAQQRLGAAGLTGTVIRASRGTG